MSPIMERVRNINERIEARTGHRPFAYYYIPAPGQRRIVFPDETLHSEEAALAKILGVQERIDAGTWDHWNCRTCPAMFNTEADRDDHEAGHQ
jgi:hypothetical protein